MPGHAVDVGAKWPRDFGGTHAVAELEEIDSRTSVLDAVQIEVLAALIRT